MFGVLLWGTYNEGFGVYIGVTSGSPYFLETEGRGLGFRVHKSLYPKPP